MRMGADAVRVSETVYDMLHREDGGVCADFGIVGRVVGELLFQMFTPEVVEPARCFLRRPFAASSWNLHTHSHGDGMDRDSSSLAHPSRL